MNKACVSWLILVVAGGLSAQVADHGRSAAPDFEVRRVAVEPGKKVTGIPPMQVVISPVLSSATGVLYLESIDLEEARYRELYSVGSDGAGVKLPQRAAELDDVTFFSFFPGENNLVTLVKGKQRSVAANAPKSDGKFYLYVSDREGRSGRLLPLTDEVTPLKVAIFPSGRMLLLGLDGKNAPTFYLLDDSGSIVRSIKSFADDYAGSQELLATFGEKRNLKRAMAGAEFVPYGKNILFLQPASKIEIIQFSESGVVSSTKVELPAGLLPQSLIPSSYQIFLRARKAEDFQKMNRTGMVVNEERPIFEIDRETGKIIREIVLSGARTGDVVSAIDGNIRILQAIYDESKNLSDTWQLMEAK